MASDKYTVEEKRENVFDGVGLGSGSWKTDMIQIMNNWTGMGTPEDNNYSRDTQELEAHFADYSLMRRDNERRALGIGADNVDKSYSDLYSETRRVMNGYYDRKGVDFRYEPYNEKLRKERETLSTKANGIINNVEKEIFITPVNNIFRSAQGSNFSEVASYLQENGYKKEFDKATDIFIKNGSEPTEESFEIVKMAETEGIKKLLDNREEFCNEMMNIKNSDELVAKWEKIRKTMPVFEFIRSGGTLSKFENEENDLLDRLGIKGEEKEKIFNSIDEMSNRYSIYVKRMTLLGSEYGKVLPVEDLENMPASDREELIDAVLKQNDEEAAENVKQTFRDIDEYKEENLSQQIDNKFDRRNISYCDEKGDLLSEREMRERLMLTGKPAFAVDITKEKPEIHVIVADGKYGDVAVDNEITEKRRSEDFVLPKKPGLFSRMLDGIARGLNLTSLRPKACLEYQKAMEQYRDAIEGKEAINETRTKYVDNDLINSDVRKFANKIYSERHPDFVKAEKSKEKAAEQNNREKVVDTEHMKKLNELENKLKDIQESVKGREVANLNEDEKIDMAAKAYVVSSMMLSIKGDKDALSKNETDNLKLNNILEADSSKLIDSSVDKLKNDEMFKENVRKLNDNEMSELCGMKSSVDSFRVVRKLTDKKVITEPSNNNINKDIQKTENQPALATDEQKQLKTGNVLSNN